MPRKRTKPLPKGAKNRRLFMANHHYTISQATGFLNVSVRTVNTMCEKGRLPGSFKGVKYHGGRELWAIPKESLHNYMEESSAKFHGRYMGMKLPNHRYVIWAIIQSGFVYGHAKEMCVTKYMPFISMKDYHNLVDWMRGRLRYNHPDLDKAIYFKLRTKLRMDNPEWEDAFHAFEIQDLYHTQNCIPWNLSINEHACWDTDLCLSYGVSYPEIQGLLDQKYKFKITVDELDAYRRFCFDWGSMFNEHRQAYVAQYIQNPIEQSYKEEKLGVNLQSFKYFMGLEDKLDFVAQSEASAAKIIDLAEKIFEQRGMQITMQEVAQGRSAIFGAQKDAIEIKERSGDVSGTYDHLKEEGKNHETKRLVRGDLRAGSMDELDTPITGSSSPIVKKDEDEEQKKNANAG